MRKRFNRNVVCIDKTTTIKCIDNLTTGIEAMRALHRDPIIHFPASKQQIIEWAAKEKVSFNDVQTHAAPKSWARFQAGPGVWYLVRVLPEVDLGNYDGVVSELDVYEWCSRKRDTMSDVYDRAAKAAIIYLEKRGF